MHGSFPYLLWLSLRTTYTLPSNTPSEYSQALVQIIRNYIYYHAPSSFMTNEPRVINIRDAPTDWIRDPRYVYIGRWHRSARYGFIPVSKWCNPFKCDRDRAITKFRAYLMGNKTLLNDIPELKNKILVCWCKPRPCHGDVIKDVYLSLFSKPSSRSSL